MNFVLAPETLMFSKKNNPLDDKLYILGQIHIDCYIIYIYKNKRQTNNQKPSHKYYVS